MAPGDVPGEPDDRPPGVAAPVRREQPREGRHQVGAPVVGDRGGQGLHLGRGRDQAEVVAQPLHQRSGDGDRALERVDGRLVADPIAHRGQQPVVAGHLRRAGVEQEEVAGAVGVLPLPGEVAGLPERRRLLVAEHAGDRNVGQRAADGSSAGAEIARGRTDLGQHRDRNPHLRGDLRVPGEGVEVHEHGAAGVGHVGQVGPAVRAAGQVPDQPAVDRAEDQIAGLGGPTGSGDLGQHPRRLGSGEVGRQRQTHPVAVAGGAAAECAEPLAHGVGPGVLPHDRRGDRFAGAAVPHHRGLALIGDADGGQAAGPHPRGGECLGDHGLRVAPDLERIVLDPARPGKDLPVLTLARGDREARPVEEDAPGTRGALVDRGDVDRLIGHGPSIAPRARIRGARRAVAGQARASR